MTDLDDRIHEGLERLVTRAPLPPSVDEVLDRGPTAGRGRPVLFGLAAAAVLVAFVAGAVVLRQAGDDTDGGPAAPADSAGPDVIAYLRPDVTDRQVGAIQALLEDEHTVTSIDFFDHDEAYEEFRSLYADDPALVESLSPETLPPSFRVQVQDHDPRLAQILADRLWATPGVREVVVRPEPTPVDPITTECGDRTLDTVPDPCAPPAPEDGDFVDVSPDGSCEAGYVPYDRDNDGGIDSCLAQADASMVETCGRLHLAVDTDGDGTLDDCMRVRDMESGG